MIILVLIALVAAYLEMRRNSIIIQPIDVPKDLADKGYTSSVVAQRLAAEISALQRAARLRGRLEEGFELSSAQIDFTVPSAGISYRGIICYLRQLLGWAEEHVQGELVRETGVIRHVGHSARHRGDVLGHGGRTWVQRPPHDAACHPNPWPHDPSRTGLLPR